MANTGENAMNMYTYLTRYSSELLREFLDGYTLCEHLGIPTHREEEAHEQATQILFDRGHL